MALKRGIEMFKNDPCTLLKDFYPKLNSIKEIIHILSIKGETQELINKLDQNIASTFENLLREISSISKKTLQ